MELNAAEVEPLACTGICVGGPAAGMIYSSGSDRLVVPERVAPGVHCEWETKGPGFTYRFTRVHLTELWAPAYWTEAQIVAEMANHYRPRCR